MEEGSYPDWSSEEYWVGGLRHDTIIPRRIIIRPRPIITPRAVFLSSYPSPPAELLSPFGRRKSDAASGKPRDRGADVHLSPPESE